MIHCLAWKPVRHTGKPSALPGIIRETFPAAMSIHELPGKVSLLFFHIYKLCIIWKPYQIHSPDRAVPLFCDDNLRNIFILRIFIVIIITVNKHSHVRILLNSPGFPEV